MELKGAEIRDFYRLTADMPSGGAPLKFPKKVKIPHYQRPYKWDSENINKLIDDWYSEQGDQYFAGSIVTVNNESKGIHELIDGQQRFTTIFLANYIRFLVSRVALRQAVSETSRIIHVTNLMDSYIRSAKFLFLNDTSKDYPLEKELDQLSTIVTNGFSDFEDEVKFSETKAKLLKIIGLPGSAEDSVDYLSDHYESLDVFLNNKLLCLSYDRTTFDLSILASLKRCCIHLHEHKQPEMTIYGQDDVKSEHERRYILALQTIFNKFDGLVGNSTLKAFDRAKAIITNIGKFLEEIALCVVQTGNAEDAYTLFEVLNDRSLALDDLDLIKNQFYKNFVLKNNALSEDELDSTLQRLDDQWVDKIFGNQADQRRKLIAYLAIVFITGDERIVYNRGDGYRRSIQNYLQGLVQYSKEEIQSHFNIFECCKIILDVAEVKFKSKDLVALEIEFDRKSSILKKSISFLMAMNQEGVLSGLTNFLLKYIEKTADTGIVGQTSISRFDPVSVRDIVKDYMHVSLPSDVERQSRRIWQISILSNSSEIPRDFAIELIKHNNLNTNSWDLREAGDRDRAKSEFEQWANNWRYSSPQLKVRLLFARLISLTLDDTKEILIRKSISLDVNEVAKLQLDHIEASQPASSHLDRYFDDEDRDSYVQSLGNMMPLPSSENIQKSNKPMKDSFAFYEQAGIGQGHHLYDAVFSNFIKNSNNDVPTKDFFQSRKVELIELFKKAIDFEG
jgi:hypothetical protein